MAGNEKQFLFKEYRTGNRKAPKTGTWSCIDLHDEQTLENITFYLEDGVTINTEAFKLRDRVIATLGSNVRFGKLETVLQGLRKAQ